MTMGIVSVSYKCDTCQRSIKLPRNSKGFEVVRRCIITQGCEGRLHKILNMDEAREAPVIPPVVEGLTDWFQRKVLFTFTQVVQSNKWLVQHNLGSKPTVQVFVEQLNEDSEIVLVEIIPEKIITIDLNSTLIIFNSQYKGVAQFISLTSANTINPSIVSTVVTPTDLQITANSHLTIATLDSSPNISLNVVYFSTSTLTVQYISIDNTPSIASPWVGVNKIFANGKRYTVRSFDLREHPLAFSFFAQGLITNGSQFYITGLSGGYGDNLILLARSPYATVDKIRNQYIDIATISQTQPELYYDSGQAFARHTIIRSTYPQIIDVA